ncbi:MAG: hypothetical protein ACYCSN_16650 [Acidobacteriaceae bacterium]
MPNPVSFDPSDDADVDPLDALDAAQHAPAPAHEQPAPAPATARNVPTGPACDTCGPEVHTWANTTKAAGKPYWRCSRCRSAWWPDNDDAQALGTKWPPFDPAKK